MTALTGAGLLALALLLGGCTPEPAPEPTPTPPFASEEEAFAAAEATYRAYVDALNQVDLSDPETFEPVFGWTTGEANAGERKSLSQMHADGWSVSGRTSVVGARLADFSPKDGEVELAVCADVSGVDVRDSNGISVVSPDRPDLQASFVTFVSSDQTGTGLVIASIGGSDQECE